MNIVSLSKQMDKMLNSFLIIELRALMLKHRSPKKRDNVKYLISAFISNQGEQTHTQIWFNVGTASQTVDHQYYLTSGQPHVNDVHPMFV